MAGTTNDKLNRLRQTKEAFRTVITRKGQTISANEPFSAWPAKIEAIPVGGGQLPTLTNPGKAADLALGKELLDGNGNIVTGTALIPGGGFIFPEGAFAPVTEFTDGKQYALVALINGTRRYINTTTYNNYTMNATAVTIQEDAEDYVIFSATPALFTAVASGAGFLLRNGNNYLHGTTTSGTALRVGTTQAVWTADASETGGFASGKYHAKEDPTSVWLKNTSGGYDWSIKFETAGSFGYDRAGRDNTYSTGFVSFVLYEYVAGEETISPIVDTSDATATESDMAKGVTAYVKGKLVTGGIEVRGEGESSGYPNGTVMTSLGDDWAGKAVATYTIDKGQILYRKGVTIGIGVPFADFGDAQPSDVAAGKYFTSVAGLRVPGTGSGGGGAAGTGAIIGSSDTSTIEIVGASAEYGALLRCRHFMVFVNGVGTNTSRSYIVGGVFSVGEDVVDGTTTTPYNRAWAVSNTTNRQVFNAATDVSVTQEGDDIRLSITLGTNYWFGAGQTVLILGI